MPLRNSSVAKASNTINTSVIMSYTLLRANFECALQIAIRTQEEFERKKLKYTMDSAFVSGIKEILKASQAGEQIYIREHQKDNDEIPQTWD